MKRVYFQPGGREITSRDGETVLSAALRQGLVFPHSCRSGNCDTCRARLISGKIAPGAAPGMQVDSQTRKSGSILLCQAVPLSDVVIEAHELEAMAGMQVRMLSTRVLALEPLSRDVTALTLGLAKGRGNLEFCAGQYVDILLWDHCRRSYSIASSPADSEVIELHVGRIRDGRFSEEELPVLKPGDLLPLMGPLGTFFLRDDPRPVIFVAEGTGFAPVAAMMEDLRRGGARRSIRFYWGVGSREDLYRQDQIGRWVRDLGIEFSPVLLEPGPDWDGRRGRVHEVALAEHADLSGMQVYASGSSSMVAAVRETFPDTGCVPMHCTASPSRMQWINPF
ncbi:MAG: 2Fe-2S iron-sulfur cluster binding domain-containing protein [Proteobacteria bacterium]|nr:2Fe-2S iron-sulfur cluster binding domain-containing protein [Pseudomonadota bacterium]